MAKPKFRKCQENSSNGDKPGKSSLKMLCIEEEGKKTLNKMLNIVE